jgi:SpoIIAA-like
LSGTVLAVHVSGKLVAADYEQFVPEFERLVLLHGKLRVRFDMTGFHGWTAGALWADTSIVARMGLSGLADGGLRERIDEIRLQVSMML